MVTSLGLHEYAVKVLTNITDADDSGQGFCTKKTTKFRGNCEIAWNLYDSKLENCHVPRIVPEFVLLRERNSTQHAVDR
jgi:hypothetical protein